MIPESSKNVEVIELTPYELLQRETYVQALNGNKAARDWVMSNMFNEEKNCVPEEVVKATDPQVIKDAILALRSLGHNASKSREIVNELVKNKVYITPQQILIDAMRKK